MLILTRRPSEFIDVTLEDGRRITFQVLGVKGNQVRVGVDAPPTVTIDRREITQRKANETGPNGDVDGNRIRGPH